MRRQNDRPQWRSFACVLGAVVAGGMAIVLSVLAVLDPYGISPIGLPKPRPLVDVNQRWMYPQIVRHGNHDSLVLGTSTSRLLRPADLEVAFGGRFANLALNDGRAWEQAQVFDLFLRERGPPRTLWIGLDTVWCDPAADNERTTVRGWPAWLWGEAGGGDIVRLIEPTSLEIAIRQIGYMLGIEKPRYDSDGFGDFTPGEAAYDIERARRHIWGDGPRIREAQEPRHVATAEERAAWRFPALVWLDDILDRVPASTRALLVFMPVHIVAQPQPGSPAAAREAACKEAVGQIAHEHGAVYLDMRVASALTADDANFWDPLHWRAPLAEIIVQKVVQAANAPQ